MRHIHLSEKEVTPQSYVGKRGYIHSESETSKMRAKMVVSLVQINGNDP